MKSKRPAPPAPGDAEAAPRGRGRPRLIEGVDSIAQMVRIDTRTYAEMVELSGTKRGAVAGFIRDAIREHIAALKSRG